MKVAKCIHQDSNSQDLETLGTLGRPEIPVRSGRAPSHLSWVLGRIRFRLLPKEEHGPFDAMWSQTLPVGARVTLYQSWQADVRTLESYSQFNTDISGLSLISLHKDISREQRFQPPRKRHRL